MTQVFRELMQAEYNLAAIKAEFGSLGRSTFLDRHIFTFLSGSVAYGGGRLGVSDIDAVTVISSGDGVPLRQYAEYAKGYISICLRHSFSPDLTYPGEILTEGLIEDAICGRGFSLDASGELFLPNASDQYYSDSRENWFRAWLSMMTFSVFCEGDREKFEVLKNRAWTTALLYILPQIPHSSISATVILDFLLEESNKWVGLGVTRRYFSFQDLEMPYITKTLQSLASHGYLQYANESSYRLAPARIRAWHEKVSCSISTRSVRQAEFLFSDDDLMRVSLYLQDSRQSL